jgi:hypothetical protein
LGLTSVLALLALGSAPALAGPALVYVSPLPGAERLRPETTLIARFDRELGLSEVAPGTFRVHGSASGDHAGSTVLSDDRRTVVFRPERPFAAGERVEAVVTFPGSGATKEFAFTIAAAPVPAFDRLALLDLPAPGAARAPAANADSLPEGPPEITSIVSGPTAPGRLFVTAFGVQPGQPCWLLILDDAARPLFARREPLPCFDFRVQPDGRLTYYDNAVGHFQVMDSSYAIVDSFACGNGYSTDVHELRLLPNGHALLFGIDPQVVDMSAIVPGGRPDATVLGMILQELDARKNVVFQWRSWDHFEITDATHVDLTAGLIDYVHSNAIDVDSDGNLLISNRHMDEITKIDRVTGETIWRWGGKHDEFTRVDDLLGFSHQHAIRWIGGDRYTLFDNGNFHPFHFSRALDYELHPATRTARLVWSFQNSTDTNAFAMGYVQRLPNGNTLVSNGFGKPDVIEVAPDGARVFELHLPPAVYSYRVFRLPWGPQAPAPPAPPIALSYSPNPARGSTRLSLDLPKPATISVGIFDVSGRRVKSVLGPRPEPAGRFAIDVDLSSLPAGLYLCRMDVGTESHVRKLVRIR